MESCTKEKEKDEYGVSRGKELKEWNKVRKGREGGRKQGGKKKEETTRI